MVISSRLALVIYASFWGALGGGLLLFGQHDTDFGWVYVGGGAIGLLRAVLPQRPPRPARRALGAWWPPSKDPGDYR